MVGQCCRGCLAITTSDRNNLTVAFESVGELNFTDDRNSFCPDLFYHFIFLRDTRTLHYFIVSAFFKFNTGIQQHVTIIVLQRACVGNKYFISLFLRQQRCTGAAFTATQYD